MTEYFKIGKIVASFGVKGEVILKHNLGKKTSLKGLKTIFIEEKKESFLPWFIENAKTKNDKEIYLKLQGYQLYSHTHYINKADKIKIGRHFPVSNCT